MAAMATTNESLFRPGGLIGREGYLRNFAKAALLFGGALLYTALLDHAGILGAGSPAAPAAGSAARDLLALCLALPAPLALLAALYALAINLIKRVRDLSAAPGASFLWIALLLVPVVGVLANAALFLRDGRAARQG